MKRLLAVVALVGVILWAGGDELSANAAEPLGGSIFSIPATGATMVLTNTPSAKWRFVHVWSNSPATLLMLPLPIGLVATNTYSYSYSTTQGVSTVITTNIFTNTMSWVTYTNALTTAAAGGTPTMAADQKASGFSFIRLGPGDYYQFDGDTPHSAGVIGVSISGTNRAIGATGEWK